MGEDIEQLAHQLRTSTTEAARACIRGALAASIRRLATERLRMLGIPKDVADDEANYLGFELVRRIERQTIQNGCEAAYVKRCAQNRATDYYRHASGVRATCVTADDEVHSIPDDRTPESILTQRQDAEALATRVARLRALIAAAPPGYAAVLEAVYVRGTLIDTMAREELELRIARGDETTRSDATLKKARATVDQRLHRARDWIRAQLGVEPPRVIARAR
jgi:DNA-directed RNA polymerase specialized sigma24 family protein